jgi:hypothetical protein
MAITNTTIGTTATIVYSSSGNSAVSVIYVCNTSASTVTFDVHLVPFGEGAAVTNQIYKSISLDASDTYILDSEKIFLGNQDRIVMIASESSALRCAVSSVQV